MVFAVRLRHLLRLHMGVPDGGLYVLVPQDFLHVADARPVVQKVRAILVTIFKRQF